MKTMKYNMRSVKSKVSATMAAFCGVILLIGCERRELYVYGDEFFSVELNVDWRKYADRDPDGMTVWFYSLDDPSHQPYRSTTAEVRRHELYLPGGHYQGVVVDYSPEEFSRQQFLGMDYMETARVEATPASYQPDSTTVQGEGVPKGVNDLVNQELFGEPAWTALHTERPDVRSESGLYIVANQPEQMALDTLLNKEIEQGEYGDYIPWKKHEEYQSSIHVKQLYAEPTSIIWRLRIRVWIRSGFNSLWQIPASVTGLADGHFLALDSRTEQPCLLSVSGWEYERTGSDSGYIGATLYTFGLRPSTILPSRVLHDGTEIPDKVVTYDTRAGELEPDYGDPEWYWFYSDNCVPRDVRLNLSFVLRDHATTRNYHFDVGDRIVSYDAQQVLRIDLGPDYFSPDNPDGPEPIDLPDVDAYNGTGFGADVTPWVDLPPIDVKF